QNRTRLLHPHIYEWPLKGAEDPSTHLPCMNWTADRAGEVVEALEKEWNELVQQYTPEVRKSTKVVNVEPVGSAGLIILRGEHWQSAPCEAVIVAVGFGLEQGRPGISAHPYWANDDFDYVMHGTTSPKRYYVSG